MSKRRPKSDMLISLLESILSDDTDSKTANKNPAHAGEAKAATPDSRKNTNETSNMARDGK